MSKLRLNRLEALIARELARQYPFVPCEECSDGWLVFDDDLCTATRCRCWSVHQAKVASERARVVTTFTPRAV